MDTLQLLGSTLGLGFVAGIRLYATILAIGLSIRLGWFHPAAGLENLKVLAEPAVLTVAGIAFVLEFFADKIPWFDSFWDSFHTFIRPIGAAVVAATAVGNLDPATRVAIAILCGGVALTSHSSKAATRLMVNHSPEPFSNIALSLAEDLFVPIGAWLSLRHPLFTLAAVLVFLAVFAWASAKVFRLIRLEVIALWTWTSRSAGAAVNGLHSVEDAIEMLSRNASLLPPKYGHVMGGSISGVRCAATKKIRGLRNSVGYLCLVNDEVVFITRRLFRYRQHRIRIAEILGAEFNTGLLLHRLILRTRTEEIAFYLFRDCRTSQVSQKVT